MRLARPVYESVPMIYAVIGAWGLAIAYLDPGGAQGFAAGVIGLLAEVAALTVFLRRQDYRELSLEYTGEALDVPAPLDRPTRIDLPTRFDG